VHGCVMGVAVLMDTPKRMCFTVSIRKKHAYLEPRSYKGAAKSFSIRQTGQASYTTNNNINMHVCVSKNKTTDFF